MEYNDIAQARFQFDDTTHEYRLDGRPLTGVTTILKVLAKPALVPWAAKMAVEFMEKAITSGEYDLTDKAVLGDLLDEAKKAHTKKKEEAGQIGVDTHSIVEAWITECLKKGEGKPRVFAGYSDIDKFVGWAQEHVERFLFSERQMYNEPHWFAGTADFGFVGTDGKRYIGDFKTSSGIWDEYWYQAAAYRFLAESMGDAPYDGLVMVRLGKDGKFEVKKTHEYTLFKDAFFNCLGIYRAQAKQREFITN